MIEVSFSFFYVVYIVFFTFLAFFMWFINEARYKSGSLEIESENAFWQCHICANTYVDSQHKDISICPRCGSYNKRTDRI